MYSPARSDHPTELTPVEVQLHLYYSSSCRLRQYLLPQLFWNSTERASVAARRTPRSHLWRLLCPV